MTRVATAENESFLLDIAQYGTTEHVVKLAGAFRTVSRAEDFDGADAMSVMGELNDSVVVSEPQRFVDRLCFSTVERSSFMSKHKHVIARNPAKFSCACCGDSLLDGRELKQAFPQAIYEGIDAKTAVTKWAGERMDLGMAVDGLLRKSGR